ncbi:hypothetical protein NDU88_003407 [Pleurodeles waltl]|uniref:Uncharacterized protein n=1 Tax=Pleurodeles waltl TaxID=8319 RepID=A0AAV7RG60_PLEWA|nr:hypothetical protein NDU88_003407 [Pleurodeles waltl]
MPGGRTASKQPGKPSRQLHFSEDLRPQRVPPAEGYPPSSMADTTQGTTMDRILQEILAMGHKLECMDSVMASVTAETKSMLLGRAGFQSQVTGLDQRVTSTTKVARTHSPLRSDDLEVRLTADFSKETSERRRAFLSLRPRLQQLDVKCGLFEPASCDSV